jgi:hypothetical protein
MEESITMKKFAFVLALSFVVAGAALAANPSLMAGGQSGTHNIVGSGRDVCWSEPVDLEGMIASSEVIGVYALETELANDFFVTADNTVNLARWWGGYWNNYGCGDIGYATNWNLRFYDDGGCMPLTMVAEYPGAFANETFVYCQAGVYPVFQYYASVSVPVTANVLYWFGAQAADHTFPPQCGRVAAGMITACDSVFKSAYFAYPDWTPAIDVFGVAFDASQEFECGIVPTNNTTWGAIKGLYR